MVLGNHEYYDGAFAETKSRAATACGAVDVRLLDASATKIAGVTVLGGTLWFRESEVARPYRRFMTDFHVIGGFEDHVYEDNRRCTEFLAANVAEGSIVVTHHLPSPHSVAAICRSGPESLLNPFFVYDCEDIIAARKPALWIHGHAHIPCDYVLGATRVVCNPIGYPSERGQGRLDFVVETPPAVPTAR
jgi:Icc-related predicted phosphoesterase